MAEISDTYKYKIKPNLKEVLKLLEMGSTVAEIYELLEISRQTWYNELDRNPTLAKKVNKAKNSRSHIIKQQIKDRVLEYENHEPYETFKNKLRKRAKDNDDISTDEMLKIIRQIFPEQNHYLQIQKEKNHIDRMKVESEIKAVSEINDKISKISILNDALIFGKEVIEDIIEEKGDSFDKN